MALRVRREHGHDVADLRSKSWDEFTEPGAPALDFIFTVCDNAAGEACPIWPGKPMTAHWGVPDAAAFEGSETDSLSLFRKPISSWSAGLSSSQIFRSTHSTG